jgi:hypothetical protein
MKKIFVLIGLLLCALTLTSCGSVEDKTYNYEGFKFEYAEGLTKWEETAADLSISLAKGVWEGYTITFNADGTTSNGGQWVQDGKEVKVIGVGSDPIIFTQDGSKLIYTVNSEDYSYTVTLVEAE